MVAVLEHLRHAQAFEVHGARELRVFQQAVAEAFLVAGFVLAHEAGLQAGRSFDDGKGRGLAAVQDGFAHADGLHGEQVEEAGVEAFVAAADEGELFFPGKFAGQLLREGAAYGRERDHAALPAVAGREFAQGAYHGFEHEHHAGAAAVGAVVHMVVAVGGLVARVGKGEAHDAGFARLFHETAGKGRVEPLGEERDEVVMHHWALGLRGFLPDLAGASVRGLACAFS